MIAVILHRTVRVLRVRSANLGSESASGAKLQQSELGTASVSLGYNWDQDSV